MRRTRKILMYVANVILVSMVFFANFQTTIFAQPYDQFSINPIIPGNQVDQNAGYFDLKMEPGQVQELPLEIYNQGDEPMTARVLVENGTTGNNASKQFSDFKEPDTSMKVPLKTIARAREGHIEVAPHSQITTFIDVDMKDVQFDGIVLGGITVIADVMDEEAATDTQSNGFSINNRLAYTLGLQLRMNDHPVEKNLNYISSGTKLIDLEPQFISTIQNDQPLLMNNISINGIIKDEGGTLIAESNRVEGGILPNTNFDVVYPTKDGQMKPGQYNMELTITDGDKTWTWKDTFSVTDKDSEVLNEEKVDFNTRSPWLLLTIIIIVMLLLIGILLFILWKKKKEQDAN